MMEKEAAKSSAFNVVMGHACANTFSKAVALLDDNELTALREDNLSALSRNQIEDLLGEGLLVHEGDDELALINNAISAARKDRTSVGYTVLVSSKCQMACPYCFQGSHDHGANMGPEVQELLVERIIADATALEHSERDALPRIGVCYTGGEPLLNVDCIERLTSELSLRLDGIAKLSTSMITNGHLLTPETASRLASVSTHWEVQITLDGPQDVHDSRRYLRGGGPTFARIVENVRSLDPDVWSVRLRVNVDKSNIDRAADAVAWADGLPNVSWYASPVTVEPTQDGGTSSACFSCNAHDRAAMWRSLAARSLVDDSLESLLEPPTQCGACSDLGFCVDPSGNLYKCFDDALNPSRSYGTLAGGTTKVEWELRYFSDPTCDSQCRECDILPICAGGCPRRSLDFGQRECPSARYLLSDALAKLDGAFATSHEG